MKPMEFLKKLLAGGCALAMAFAGAGIHTTEARGTEAGVGWRVLEAATYENLALFPVVARQTADTSAFVTLDEALASGDAVVSEQGGDLIPRSRDGRPLSVPQGGAQVNRLALVHRGSKSLLLLAGEVVSGGKQDRVIAKDRIVRPGSDPLPLDVFCVEHGRWSGGSSFFSAAKTMVHPSVREKAAVEQKQDQVWAAVRSGSTHPSAVAAPDAPPGGVASTLSRAEIANTVVVEAQSESYDKIYGRSRIGQSVDAFAEEAARRFAKATAGLKDERVIGVVVAYGGEVAWADTFASGELFSRYGKKLLRSYAVEAMARPRSQERAALDDAREFLLPLRGRETIETEPGIYRWRQVNEGRYSEIEIAAVEPKLLALHRVKIHRTM